MDEHDWLAERCCRRSPAPDGRDRAGGTARLAAHLRRLRCRALGVDQDLRVGLGVAECVEGALDAGQADGAR